MPSMLAPRATLVFLLAALIWALSFLVKASRFNPAAPKWLNRDRFILSAGHGSMFIYSWLHLAGFKVSGQDVADFRKLHSITPGHPEFDETEGVEATTGPLGQGVGNAVGYALSGKRAAARYNTAEHTIFDHHVVALAGDGCLQEGVAQEAIAFAGHNQLDNLILIYDSNDVTLDAMADKTQGWDSEAYFKSLSWNAVTIDGHDMDAFLTAFTKAKAGSGKPTVIIAKTEIGRGIPQVAGTAGAHGEGGANFSERSPQGTRDCLRRLSSFPMRRRPTSPNKQRPRPMLSTSGKRFTIHGLRPILSFPASLRTVWPKWSPVISLIKFQPLVMTMPMQPVVPVELSSMLLRRLCLR